MAIMSDQVVLLEFWSSPFVARVKIALEEKGVTNYESREEEDLLSSKSPLLVEMNPVHKKVPVLIHNGKPICESLAIVEYIDQVWRANSVSLMPSDAYGRAQARFWADYNDKMFFNSLKKIWRQKDEPSDQDKKEFLQILKTLESELGGNPYFGGEMFGYLDIALIPDYSWFYTYETWANLSIEHECPELVAWARRCLQRDSVKNCLADPLRIWDYALQLKKRFGTD